jgi:hypothetical protein
MQYRRNALNKFWTAVLNPSRFSLPVLSAAEQTRLSWARAVEAYDQLPEIYRDFFATLPRTDRFPRIIITPTLEGFIQRQTEKLVCSLDDEIYVVERIKNTLVTTRYSIGCISYVQVGKILLKAWMTIRGIASDGIPASSTFRFNAVNDYLFAPMLDRIRGAPRGPAGADLNVERSKFNYLNRLNFKFMNYGRGSLVPGERVASIVLQPEIRAKVLAALSVPWFRTVFPAYLMVLTDSELIIIMEENTGFWRQEIKYGGIWNYVPLNKITAISFTRQDADRLTLSIQLPEDDHIDLLLANSGRQAMNGFLDQLAILLPAIAINE